MADLAKRGGQKKGTRTKGDSQEHQGVRPGSTTQNKNQRQRLAERRAGDKNRVVEQPDERL